MAQQPYSPQPQGSKDNKSSYSKDNLVDYFKDHSRETISYILLIAGILMIIPWPFYGGLLVGIVGGIYFGDAIINYIKNWKGNVSSTGNYSVTSRHLVLLGVAIAFFLTSPAIYIGAAVAIGIKQLFVS